MSLEQDDGWVDEVTLGEQIEFVRSMEVGSLLKGRLVGMLLLGEGVDRVSGLVGPVICGIGEVVDSALEDGSRHGQH